MYLYLQPEAPNIVKVNEAEYIHKINADNLVENFDFEDISIEEFLLLDEMDDIVLTDFTTGQTNKTALLATLTDSHFEIILSPIGWLDCDIIHQVPGSSSCSSQFNQPFHGRLPTTYAWASTEF